MCKQTHGYMWLSRDGVTRFYGHFDRETDDKPLDAAAFPDLSTMAKAVC